MIRNISKNLRPLILNQIRGYPLRNVSSEEVIRDEVKYSCNNYHPLPVVCAKAEGIFVWDPEGKKYYDFLSAYSAVNQGHCHPRLIKALTDQASKITLCSRAFHSQVLVQWAKFMCETFGYSCVLPMNTGAEAVESAIKIARKWGYYKKGIPDQEAYIIACNENFHGRTLGIISMSTDPLARNGYGPYLPGVLTIPYNNVKALEDCLNKIGPKVCGFLIEPIQGEAGIFIPDDGYLKKVQDLCKKHQVLFMCDEIQTGLGRTGKLCSYEHEPGVRPDIVTLGKALSGGILPVSAVLADHEIMDVIKPGTHGSTYGGNPLSCAVSMEAVNILKDEGLLENSAKLGKLLGEELNKLVKPDGVVKLVRGRGLLWAIVCDPNHPKMKGITAYQICKNLKEKGMLCKQTHDYIIRLAPPLVITEQQILECVKIIKDVFEAL
jgi:ornithine--oxo-acid transaminase